MLLLHWSGKIRFFPPGTDSFYSGGHLDGVESNVDKMITRGQRISIIRDEGAPVSQGEFSYRAEHLKFALSVLGRILHFDSMMSGAIFVLADWTSGQETRVFVSLANGRWVAALARQEKFPRARIVIKNVTILEKKEVNALTRKHWPPHRVISLYL